MRDEEGPGLESSERKNGNNYEDWEARISERKEGRAMGLEGA